MVKRPSVVSYRLTAVAVVLLWTPGLALLYNVDQPVPLSLAHGEYYFGARLWGKGGVLARFGVGLFDRLTLGVSYGGDRLIGAETPEFFDRARPEFQARFGILAESGYFPDFILGYESQGYDDCVDGVFGVREKGGYACLGKTIEVTRTYLQLGFNYLDGANGFAVVNQLLPGNLELIVEYDPAFNDRTDQGRGFLNLGVAWTFNDQLRFAIGLRDILGNREGPGPNRVIDLSFHDLF